MILFLIMLIFEREKIVSFQVKFNDDLNILCTVLGIERFVNAKSK